MTMPYGVTDYGITRQLKDNNVTDPKLVSKYIKIVVEKELRGYKTVKTYLETIARILNEIDVTLEWFTESSFRFRATYQKLKTVKIPCGGVTLTMQKLCVENFLMFHVRRLHPKNVN